MEKPIIQTERLCEKTKADTIKLISGNSDQVRKETPVCIASAFCWSMFHKARANSVGVRPSFLSSGHEGVSGSTRRTKEVLC